MTLYCYRLQLGVGLDELGVHTHAPAENQKIWQSLCENTACNSTACSTIIYSYVQQFLTTCMHVHAVKNTDSTRRHRAGALLQRLTYLPLRCGKALCFSSSFLACALSSVANSQRLDPRSSSRDLHLRRRFAFFFGEISGIQVGIFDILHH